MAMVSPAPVALDGAVGERDLIDAVGLADLRGRDAAGRGRAGLGRQTIGWLASRWD